MPNSEHSPSSADPVRLPGVVRTGLRAVINHLLASDPQACDRLVAHAGRSLLLTTAGIELHWVIGADGLLREAAPEDAVRPPDLHVVLDTQALREAIANRTSLRLSGTRMTGDAELAQALSWLLAHVRWDAEDDLARVIGDIPARRVAQTGKAALDQAATLWARAGDGTRDWFARAPRDLVSRHEMAALQEGVRDLRDAAARLEKRLALLRRQLGAVSRD